MTRTSYRRAPGAVAVAVLATGAVALVAATAGSARPGAPGPTLVEEPSISGVALVGNELDAHPGHWTGVQPISFKYQWLRCAADAGSDSSSASCSSISGATTDEYEVTSSDIGKRIRVRVTAGNKQGQNVATSAATSVVSTEGGKPASSSPPTVSGSATVGSTLTGSKGTWVGDEPITYQYAWLRCNDAGDNCAVVSGATKSTYKVVQKDVGKTLRFGVRAKNARGTSDAFSVATDVVKDAADGGIIVLPDGSKSVDVKDVPKGERLIVDKVVFSPSVLTSPTAPIVTYTRVKDTRGYVVRNAVVFIRSTPKVTSGGDNAPTAVDGWVSYTLVPEDDIQLKTGYSIQFYVKAYRKGDDPLAGVSGTRLVQVETRTP